jgi:hypothetical protein
MFGFFFGNTINVQIIFLASIIFLKKKRKTHVEGNVDCAHSQTRRIILLDGPSHAKADLEIFQSLGKLKCD